MTTSPTSKKRPCPVEGGVAVDEERILAPRIIITTGARPAMPAIPGIETMVYLTSTSALALEELLKSFVVIGGGYIGAELAPAGGEQHWKEFEMAAVVKRVAREEFLTLRLGGEEYAVDAKTRTGSGKVDVPVRSLAERSVVARAGTGDVTVSGG